MQLEHCDIIRSPDRAGHVRLVGSVSYEDRPGRPEHYWFEVSEQYAADLSQSGNPWLAFLLPLAMTLGEPLRLNLAVDETLLDNTHTLMAIWSKWYPERQIVPIEAETLASSRQDTPARTAAFFSGGVDSCFTTLHFDAEAERGLHRPIDDFITLWGFDVPLDNPVAFRSVREQVEIEAATFEKELIVIKTNVRDTRLRELAWLSHFGAVLAGLGLILEQRFAQVLISAGYGHKNQKAISGSHPRTDPLLSTRRTRIVHYGTEYDRFERTAYISESAVAMKFLRVCWESSDGRNCGVCEKCIRTMATLDVLGILNQCETFPIDSYSMKKIEKTYSGAQQVYFRSLREHALDHGRPDVAAAIGKGLEYSMRLDRWLLLPRLRQANLWLKRSMPFLWKLLLPVRSVLKRVINGLSGAAI